MPPRKFKGRIVRLLGSANLLDVDLDLGFGITVRKVLRVHGVTVEDRGTAAGDRAWWFVYHHEVLQGDLRDFVVWEDRDGQWCCQTVDALGRDLVCVLIDRGLCTAASDAGSV